jgi:hypothetical protein
MRNEWGRQGRRWQWGQGCSSLSTARCFKFKVSSFKLAGVSRILNLRLRGPNVSASELIVQVLEPDASFPVEEFKGTLQASLAGRWWKACPQDPISPLNPREIHGSIDERAKL